jgi:hypothetical protein
MPLQTNRVPPTGEIVNNPARGMFTGNRGILHRSDGTLWRASRWTHKHWLVCGSSARVYHGPMPDKAGWSALFFSDEAVALGPQVTGPAILLQARSPRRVL